MVICHSTAESTVKRVTRHVYLNFALVCHLGFSTMSKAEVAKTLKIHPVLQDFSEKFMKTPNKELYCYLCSCTVCCSKRFLVQSHRNTTKQQKAFGNKFKLLIPLQKFSSNTDFMEKAINAFTSADIPLHKLNNKHIKPYFTTLVTVCHLKLLIEKQLCNQAQMS